MSLIKNEFDAFASNLFDEFGIGEDFGEYLTFSTPSSNWIPDVETLNKVASCRCASSSVTFSDNNDVSQRAIKKVKVIGAELNDYQFTSETIAIDGLRQTWKVKEISQKSKGVLTEITLQAISDIDIDANPNVQFDELNKIIDRIVIDNDNLKYEISELDKNIG